MRKRDTAQLAAGLLAVLIRQMSADAGIAAIFRIYRTKNE